MIDDLIAELQRWASLTGPGFDLIAVDTAGLELLDATLERGSPRPGERLFGIPLVVDETVDPGFAELRSRGELIRKVRIVGA